MQIVAKTRGNTRISRLETDPLENTESRALNQIFSLSVVQEPQWECGS